MVASKDKPMLLQWDECDGDPHLELLEDQTLSLDATDDEVVAFLRKTNGDEIDAGSNDYYWRAASISRGERTTTVEFHSGRGHLSVNVLMWF
jgi:hypothetical protein